ncbi:lipocalin family protein [Acinetobacter rudis]|uniref:Outer membrane lipoprotein Blc n=1 Tax=Acinetobacter rudis TaxID=632955 RepID=A0AAW8J9Q5_9GAMM|nr:lipocalin family protein [Acinetobacter rudis]MDQ8935718.1 lipocalin family protein [Acinetobacter rudis]MDQ8952010.1 lipocalin family protein [Acinetobacter rudis]MDQ9017981.1 lipocalin family protein [Acinetobacter rudis]
MNNVMIKQWLTNTVLTVCGVCAFSLSTQAADLSAVEKVEIDKFLGVWYEILSKPSSTEKRCSRDITSTYTLNEYGHLLAERQCLDQDAKPLTLVGEAYPVNAPRYSKFKLSFMPEAIRWLPLAQNDYWILKLDDQYQMALIGEPNRQALWLLSRQPHPNQALIQQYLNYAKNLGYKVEDVIYTTHQ